MKYLQFNEQDFQEYLFNIESATFEKKDKKVYSPNYYKYNLGFHDNRMEQKGQFSVLHEKFLFKENITLKFKKSNNAILLSFVKKGGNIHFVNKKTNIQQSFCTNTHGVYFMCLDTPDDIEFLQKDKEQEFTIFFIPISYFEQLVNMYPNLFEQSFIRYQKGESFFQSKNFAQSTSTHYNILSQIENSYLMGNCCNAYVDAKILELLSMYFNSCSEHSIVKCNPVINYDKIKEAEFILISNLNSPPSVKLLSLEVGLNPNTLQAGFKEIFNNTVYGHLFNYKMQLATHLLRDTNQSISEIAEQCGYDYDSHFCTAFKRNFGISPKEARNRFQ